MKTKIIITIIGLLYITIQQPLIAQNMGKIEVKRLSKKEVKNLLETNQAVLNNEISERLFAKVYVLETGEVLLVNDSGQGGIWKSLDDFNNFGKEDDESKAELSVLNLEGWLSKDSNIEALIAAANKLLSGVLGKEIDYSEKSLKAVGKIRIKNVVAQKDTFYAILLYACGYYAHHYGGRLEIIFRDNELYMPYVIGDKGRSFTPYMEYWKGISESPRISLEESINLERIKYNLRTD